MIDWKIDSFRKCNQLLGNSMVVDSLVLKHQALSINNTDSIPVLPEQLKNGQFESEHKGSKRTFNEKLLAVEGLIGS